ncbi:hypothetical protein Tco_0813226 [Tanacetum coccineum]
MSNPSTDSSDASPVKVDIPSELPRKLKGKDIVDNVAHVSNATTIALGMYKFDPVILAPRDKNNRETHIYYLKHTMEQAVILRKIVEQAKSLNPLDSASYTACKYVKLIQKLLGYVRDTCPDIHTPRKDIKVKKSKNRQEIKRQVQEKDLKPISKAGSRPWSRKVKKVKKRTKEK